MTVKYYVILTGLAGLCRKDDGCGGPSGQHRGNRLLNVFTRHTYIHTRVVTLSVCVQPKVIGW